MCHVNHLVNEMQLNYDSVANVARQPHYLEVFFVLSFMCVVPTLTAVWGFVFASKCAACEAVVNGLPSSEFSVRFRHDLCVCVCG